MMFSNLVHIYVINSGMRSKDILILYVIMCINRMYVCVLI